MWFVWTLHLDHVSATVTHSPLLVVSLACALQSYFGAMCYPAPVGKTLEFFSQTEPS